MVYASVCKRIITFLVFFFSVATLEAMVMDNRYFPLFPQLYTGAHKDKACISASIIFMTGGEAYSPVPMASDTEKIIGYPALFGKNVDKQGHINLGEVDLAIQSLTGSDTLLTPPFQAGKNNDLNIDAHLQAQGFTFAGNVPVTSHFSFGWSALFMRVIGEARMFLNIDAARTMDITELDATGKLVVTDAGEVQFVENLSQIQKSLGMNENVWASSGSGDLILYGSWYNSEQYKWKCRVVDFSMSLGAIIPIGEDATTNNIASVPFGGSGHWGWFAMPHLELELRDDLKIGLMTRLSKRFKKIKELRVPILKESPLFAPYKANVSVTPGVTISIAPYVVFEHVRSGFGVELKYTIIHHEGDTFVDARTDTTQNMNLKRLITNGNNPNSSLDFSSWTQEYATMKIVYDIGYGKDWRYRPVFNFTWNVPLNYIAGQNFAKTHGISLGYNFNF